MRPTLRRRAVVAGISAAALLLPIAAQPGAAAAPAAPATDLARYYRQTLQWSPCQKSMECAWLTVPLDYAEADGATIRLRVSKVPATGSQRAGSIVVNPGGPGASGLDFGSYLTASMTPALRASYDVVGFDPRGVGKSAPITCMTGVQTTAWLAIDGSPDTIREEGLLMRAASRIPRGCLLRSPKIARHVGTANTVRDVDILREALGDAKLNWFGFSYGTYIGTLYAEEFPNRVGRMVLDGPMDPSLDIMQISQDQSRGFQTAMTRFAQDCIEHENCPWRGSAKAVITGINRLLVRLDRRPMHSDQGPPLLQSQALSAMFYSMYSPDLWPLLRYALKGTSIGDPAAMTSLFEFANDKTGPTTYGSNMASAFPAISCWDAPPPPGEDGLRAAAAEWSRSAPVPDMARAMAWGNAPCSFWFGHAERAPAPAQSTTTAPILIVGTTYDPATPYPWAQALSSQLGTSALLTYVGDGHTAYGRDSSCIDDTVNAYLLDGTLPAEGATCS